MMKRIAALSTALVLAFALVACGKTQTTTPSATQPSTTQQETSQPESIPEDNSTSESTPDAPEEPVLALDYPAEEQGEWQPLDATSLSATEQDMILQLVNNVVAGYNSGALPLEVMPETEYWMNEEMPVGVTLPTSVAPGGFTVENFDEMWQIVARVPAEGGQLTIAMNSQTMGSGEIAIVVREATFADVQPSVYS